MTTSTTTWNWLSSETRDETHIIKKHPKGKSSEAWARMSREHPAPPGKEREMIGIPDKDEIHVYFHNSKEDSDDPQSAVETLKAKYDAAQKEANRIQQALWKAENELKATQMKALSNATKKGYLTRLKRLKRYMLDWLGPKGCPSQIQVAFRKMEEPYADDYYDDMDDPLDWMTAEYDLLGMSDHLEIRIDYFNEAVKEFVTVWFKTHMKKEHYDIVDEKSLFAFNRVAGNPEIDALRAEVEELKAKLRKGMEALGY